MNQPAPEELCKKLESMGCVSESGLFWPKQKSDEPITAYEAGDTSQDVECGAFLQNDFTGATERAVSNMAIAIGASAFVLMGEFTTASGVTEAPCPVCDATEPDRAEISNVNFHRHAMIDCYKMGETWFQYLDRMMKKDLNDIRKK